MTSRINAPATGRFRGWLAACARSVARRVGYLAAYRRDTDRRVRDDPRAAVGGRWEELGALQFDYLRARGLAPHHRLLDVGCGTLRGGRHFIRHLEPRRYTGIDLSAEAIAYGRKLVADEGLSDREPRLLVSARGRLDFAELAGETFDVVLAHSVFTHLPAAPIAECFGHLGALLADGGAFWFTFLELDAACDESWKSFRHPFALFAELAARNGLRAELRGDYVHPRGQLMARATR